MKISFNSFSNRRRRRRASTTIRWRGYSSAKRSWASHAVLAGFPYQPRVRYGRGLVPALRAISFGLRKPVYVEVWVRRYHHQAQGRSGRGPKPAPAPAPPLTSPFKWIRSLLIAHQPAPLLTPPPRPRHPLRHPPRHPPPPPPPPPLLRPSP